LGIILFKNIFLPLKEFLFELFSDINFKNCRFDKDILEI